MNGEEWRVIPGFPSYAVSSFGRIKRVISGKTSQAVEGKFLRQGKRGSGYLGTTLRKDGRSIGVYTHTLVLIAFVGERPSDKHQAAHNNGDSLDNRLENLRWALPSENAADKIKHGTLRFGDRHHNAKLTEKDVREIRERRAAGEYYKNIAADFGISKAYCCLVTQGKRWARAA